jgi:hypothetical protein
MDSTVRPHNYAAGQPRRGEIFVENGAQQNLQPRQGRHIPQTNATMGSAVRPHKRRWHASL